MVVDGEPIGLLRLWRRPDRGELPSADLVLVEAMATAASAVLDDHRKRLDAPVPVVEEPRRPRGPDEATTPHVAVRAFGPFEVRVDGVPLRPSDVGRRKALTLLKVLVAHEGRPVSRDALIEYLWPGGDPDTKTGQLYVLVHELRRRIEPPGGPEYLSCVEGRYQFDPSGAAWVDVRDYQALAQQAARAAERGDHPRALAAAEAAVELYRGEFMEDEPYADWCQLAREQLRESCLGLLRQLADQAAAAHAWMRSVAYLRAAARLEPLREETHRRLMEALWRSGRRTEALQQYRTCEDLLHTELGVAPLPATRRLHQAIRSDAEPPA